MSLMLRARWKAWLHVMQFWVMLDMPNIARHRIWRVYSHMGFKTRRIFCECGKEFR